jgi:cupin fold WbuC family metalloprotein
MFEEENKNFRLSVNENEIKAEYINILTEKLKINKNKRIRICIHDDDDEKVHIMLIYMLKDTDLKMHKHLNRKEVYVLIDGEADFLIYDDEKNLIKKINFSNKIGGVEIIRTLKNQYHNIEIKSEILKFLEITEGPFNRVDTIY